MQIQSRLRLLNHWSNLKTHVFSYASRKYCTSDLVLLLVREYWTALELVHWSWFVILKSLLKQMANCELTVRQ